MSGLNSIKIAKTPNWSLNILKPSGLAKNNYPNKEVFNSLSNDDYPKFDWEYLKQHCPAAALYESAAEVMPQEPWALFAGIVVRAENGVELFHTISSVYPTYDFKEAQDIAERAQGPKGALLCETVEGLEVLGEACKNCRFKGILK